MVPAIKPRAAGAISEVAGSPCLKPVARVRATPEGWFVIMRVPGGTQRYRHGPHLDCATGADGMV